MKGKYVKPMLAIENFKLSECIAGCGGGDTFQVDDNCASNFDWDVVNQTILDMLEDGETYQYDYPDGSIVKICKHASQGYSVFTS